MAITLVKGIHITATEKNAISSILQKGWLKGSTKRKFYNIEDLSNGRFCVVIRTKMKNDKGQDCIDKNTVEIELK